MFATKVLLGVSLLCAVIRYGNAQDVTPRRMKRSSPSQHYELVERFRTGALAGPGNLGRVMDVAFDNAGRIIVADDSTKRIVIFDSSGHFVRAGGRQGRNLGEFENPWIVASDASDSIFVWDISLSRITVFDSNLRPAREFPVLPHWMVGGIRFLADGRLVLEAYGRGELGVVHILGRDGSVQQTFGPVPSAQNVEGFEGSLLGGTIAVSKNVIAYSNKSPYEISFFDHAGKPISQCLGLDGSTTTPGSVVTTTEFAKMLSWNRYVHSARIIPLQDSVFLNIILDPIENKRVLEVVTTNCALLNRSELATTMMITDRRGSRLVAVHALQRPEIVVYDFQPIKSRK